MRGAPAGVNCGGGLGAEQQCRWQRLEGSVWFVTTSGQVGLQRKCTRPRQLEGDQQPRLLPERSLESATRGRGRHGTFVPCSRTPEKHTARCTLPSWDSEVRCVRLWSGFLEASRNVCSREHMSWELCADPWGLGGSDSSHWAKWDLLGRVRRGNLPQFSWELGEACMPALCGHCALSTVGDRGSHDWDRSRPMGSLQSPGGSHHSAASESPGEWAPPPGFRIQQVWGGT